MKGGQNRKHGVILGIDLGTTTVKVSVIDAVTKRVATNQSYSQKTFADVPNLPPGFSEQYVEKIWTALNILLAEIGPHTLSNVIAVGICGQQHGVMLWKRKAAWSNVTLTKFTALSDICEFSNLITWQDQRCTKDFLETLPKPQPDQVLATGYGSCSLFWLQKNDPAVLEYYSEAGTIMDFIACLLTNSKSAVISPHNAESWGFFDRHSRSWNTKILTENQFPVGLLPLVCNTTILGVLRPGSSFHGMNRDRQTIPVSVAMGDLQTSFIATVAKDTDAVLNFSTSSQISFIRSRADLVIPSACDVRSYFSSTSGKPSHSGRELVVAPSLNGGNVLTFFVKTLLDWIGQFDLDFSEDVIWSKIISAANSEDWTTSDDPTIRPTIYAERFDSNLRASVEGLSLENVKLGFVTRGFLKGVIENLAVMLPPQILLQSSIDRIVLTGSLFKKFPQLCRYVTKVFGLPVVVQEEEGRDAAFGAALAVSLSL
ncbi:hypothetical protein RvY_06450 [Ramazzottius varieornatus]|uniref:Carbohydrate kinase FGGY N-terminal domain-containing protein n=1 Tax=Ramazzottius varieornatus TaxID=947166 RepID=A0A1D1V4W9_RAMVA|nr:hypothetical protein RvY_06450 [Ramazzottius varieornatus]